MNRKDVSVTLSVYEWFSLLKELEHLMRFVNRDSSMARKLHSAISDCLE